MPGSRSSHARTRLVLPPPDGAARTKEQADAGGALVAIGSAPTYSRPPWPSSCNDAWSVGRRRSFGDANLSAAGPSQGANSSPSGGSAAANAASVGVQKLLHILHLLAHLLDQHLEFQRRLRNFSVDRLAAQRVGLAVQFLRKKIQPLTGAAAGAEHAPHLGHVRGQPRQFLGDVDLGGEQGEFLFQAIVVRVELSVAQTQREFLVERGVNGRDARRHARDFRLDAVATCLEDGFNLGAFPPPRRRQVGQRPVDKGRDPRRKFFGRNRRLGQNPGPAQDFVDREGQGGRNDLRDLIGSIGAFPDFGRIARDRGGAGSGPGQRHAALDLAAFEIARQAFAQRGLQVAQFVGQPDGDVEIAVIHRPQFDRQRQAGQFGGLRCKAGHTEDHGIEAPWLAGRATSGSGGVLALLMAQETYSQAFARLARRFLYFGCRVAENVSANRPWRKPRGRRLACDLRLLAVEHRRADPKSEPRTLLEKANGRHQPSPCRGLPAAELP